MGGYLHNETGHPVQSMVLAVLDGFCHSHGAIGVPKRHWVSILIRFMGRHIRGRKEHCLRGTGYFLMAHVSYHVQNKATGFIFWLSFFFHGLNWPMLMRGHKTTREH